MSRPPLLVTLKRLIERSYGFRELIGDIGDFIVGDRGLRSLYDRAGERAVERGRAQVLVRQSGESLRASLYLPDALVRHLERFDPAKRIGDENIDAFAALVEEVDHLIVLASRAAERRPATLLELEYHAGVTKYLVVLHFLGRQSGRDRVTERHRRWARHHLFERFAAGGGREGSRYREAAALALRYVRYLERMPIAVRLAEMRALGRRPFSETCRLVALQA